MKVEFGKLEDIDLRNAWTHEANDFTPWLANNLEWLSDAVGIRLELEGTEVSVDQFSADILARNQADGSNVLIENQLEKTDHTHLGQILTYLAGLEARTVIWIARDFHEAHLSAVRWLNENTTDTFAFFAVRLKVVRIGDSPLAPVFEVLERPSGWERQLRTISRESREGLSKVGVFRREYWTHYAECYPSDNIPSNHAASSVWHEVPDKKLIITQYITRSSVGMFLRGRRNEQEEVVFPRVKQYEVAFREKLDFDLTKASWGTAYDIASMQIDTYDRANWNKMADWHHSNLIACRNILTEG